MHDDTNTPTGRENALVLYCPACGWRRDAIGVNECGACGRTRLRFIRYERGVEDAEVERIIQTGYVR